MKNRLSTLIAAAALVAAFATFGQTNGQSPAKPDKKIEIQLLWGTDAAKSPNPAHKPVEADIQRRLRSSPLKWTNYFLVKKMTVSVPRRQATRQPISDKCAIEIQDLGNTMLELSFYGKDKKVEKRKQALPRGDVFVYSGNAPGTNAWLLVLKRLD